MPFAAGADGLRPQLSRASVRSNMTEREFEKYCFLRLYSIDMDTAYHTIKMLKRYRRDDIKVALLRDIAVTYSHPFTGNKGIKISKHFLSEKHVPKQYKSLHKKLLESRNGQFAHTDVKFHKPKVMRWRGDAGNAYPMSFKSFDYLGLFRQLPEIEKLIKAVESSLRMEVKQYESCF